jgi:hypothetical protein
MNLGWAAPDVLLGPDNRLNTGFLSLNYAQNLSMFEQLKMLLSIETAGHLKNENVHSAKVKAIVLHPGPRVKKGCCPSGEDTNGFISLSGEKVDYNTITMEVHAGMMNVLAPFWLDEDKLSKVE